jgi:antitoxin component YwqK of YwqJK toxin-antitoxin module
MKTKPLTFLLALTFLFLFSGSVFGQEEVKKEFYDSGELLSETHYKNGEREGLETRFYESGEKKSEVLWKGSETRGPETNWYKSGKKKSEICCRKNGVRWEGGYLYWEEEVITSWYESGKKKSETHLKDGGDWGLGNSSWIFMKGVETSWYESGKKKSEVLWENGKQDGIINGKRDGIRKEWNEEGKLTFEEKFSEKYEE